MDTTTTTARYTVCLSDPTQACGEYTLEGDTVEALAVQYAELSFDVGAVEVRSENGELRGWIHANGDWRCA